MTISIAALTERFGPALEVAPWGSCLVVQGTEFDPDWEAELGDLGYRCHFGTLDQHAVTFVQLKKAVVPGKTVYVPSKPTEFAPARVYWSSEEDAYLVELWKSNLTIIDINLRVAAKFPCRVGVAAKQRLDRLKKAGKIQPRQKQVPGNEVKDMENKYKVASRGSGCQKGPDWSESQVALLLARWEALEELPKEHRSAELAKMPEFAGRSANSILQKAYKLQKQKTSKEAKKHPDILEHVAAEINANTSQHKVEPADPDSNEYIDAWNKAVKVESAGGIPGMYDRNPSDPYVPRQSNPDPDDDADVLLNLVKEVSVLREGYTSLIQVFAELQIKLRDLEKENQKTLGVFANETASNEELAAVRKDLAVHEHARSGKTMIPLEAS